MYLSSALYFAHQFYIWKIIFVCARMYVCMGTQGSLAAANEFLSGITWVAGELNPGVSHFASKQLELLNHLPSPYVFFPQMKILNTER